MPKSRNLPMTTREPISDAKARGFLLPSLSWGSHRYQCSGYREEPRVLGYVAYIGNIQVKGDFQAEGHPIVTFFYRVVCGFLIGFYFQGESQVPERKVRRFNLRADWLVSSGARLGNIQSLSLFAWNFTKWSSFTRWSSLGSPLI